MTKLSSCRPVVAREGECAGRTTGASGAGLTGGLGVQDYLSPGEHEDHVAFDTDHGKAGMLVCWDMAWSEAFRSVSTAPPLPQPFAARALTLPLALLAAAPPGRRARYLVHPQLFELLSFPPRTLPLINRARSPSQPDLLDRDRRRRARPVAQPRLGGDLPRLARRHPRVRERVLRRVRQLRRPQGRRLHRPQRRHPPLQGQGRRHKDQRGGDGYRGGRLGRAKGKPLHSGAMRLGQRRVHADSLVWACRTRGRCTGCGATWWARCAGGSCPSRCTCQRAPSCEHCHTFIISHRLITVASNET